MDASELQQLRVAHSSLLAGDAFRRSPALGRLLTYLVERVLAAEISALKEGVIGHELYGRQAGYDPKLDSVVRVSAKRLRLRLEDHYRDHPDEWPRIVLPKGSYIPAVEVGPPTALDASAQDRFESREAVLPPPEPASVQAQPQDLAKPGQRYGRGQPQGLRGTQAAAALLVLLLLLGALLWSHNRRPSAALAGTEWSVRPFARLGGSQQFAAFSPEGKRVAFTSTTTHDSREAIYIQALDSEEAKRVTLGFRAAWSPDGKRLAFLRPVDGRKKLVVLRDLGTGRETELAQLGNDGLWLCQVSRVSWSPDGATLYTAATQEGGTTCTIVAIDVATGHVRIVTRPASPVGDMDPAISPDGSTLAFTRGQAAVVFDLFLVGTHGGDARRLTYDATDLTGLDWDPNGKALIVASRREGGARRLWWVPADGTPAQVLTDGSSAPTFPAVNAAGRHISFTQFDLVAPIWKLDGQKATEILDNQSRNFTPAVSPDGKKLLYTSDQGGRWESWLSNADGSDARTLLRSRQYDTGAARWSPDGTQAVLECHISRQTHLCLWDAGSDVIRQLTGGQTGQVNPSWSRDGHLLYFTDDVSGREEIYRIPVGGGAATQLTHNGATRALESWDGRWLYVARGEPVGGLVVLPLHGSAQEWAAAEKTAILPELRGTLGSGWDVTRNGLVFVEAKQDGTSALAEFDPASHTRRPLFAPQELMTGTDISVGAMPDGHGFMVSAVHRHSELSMMSGR